VCVCGSGDGGGGGGGGAQTVRLPLYGGGGMAKSSFSIYCIVAEKV